ncbi:MAG: hypothetical protein V4612_00015 [Pseudomonadota bacterium]
MTEQNLSAEIVRLLEAGINKHLNRSFIYSPLKLFYNLFKKNNPQTIASIREMVRDDVEKCLSEIDNFKQEIFVAANGWTMPGKDFLRACYNIGINLLRKKLTVMTAFKAFRDSAVRDNIYNDLLEEVRSAAIKVMSGLIERNKA